MSTALDPFQLITDISFRSVERTPWFQVGRVSILENTPPGGATGSLCGGGSFTLSAATGNNLWEYTLTSAVTLTAPIYNCDQLRVELRGQSSGYEHIADLSGKDILGFPGCVTNTCWLNPQTDNYHRYQVASRVPSWRDVRLASVGTLGFTSLENLDIRFQAAPFFDIVSITSGSTGIVVETSTAVNLTFDDGVSLTGTGIYDGLYTVFDPISATEVELDTLYFGDVTTGQLQPRYDCQGGC